MSSPIGMAEYFAMEAGEYLDRLAGLVGKDAPPRRRGARALFPGIARERAHGQSSRSSRAQPPDWKRWPRPIVSPAVPGMPSSRSAALRPSRISEPWSSRPEAGRRGRDAGRASRARSRVAGWGGLARPVRDQTPPRSAAPGTDAGVRAFVAREGALTASALDRAARALRTSPEAHEPLYAVLRRLQSLRGLAALTDLAPLPDVLESVERAVGELTRMFAPPPQVSEVFEAAAQALARCARDVAQSDAHHPTRKRRGNSPSCCFGPSPRKTTSSRSSRSTMMERKG